MAALIRLALGFAYGGGSVKSDMVLLADEDVMEVIASHINRCGKRHFLRHLYIKTNILPRQARDKHRENSKKRPCYI
jgi:hypothetical protein